MAYRKEQEHHFIFHEEINTNNSLSKKNDKNPINLTLRFLKPCTQELNQAKPIPNNPLLSEIFPQNLYHWPSKVLFRGWLSSPKRWKEWFDRICGKYSAVWYRAGICDAILSSIYVVPRNQDLVLGISEFWSPETNTFVFPWREATVTLEDIMILGGYSVLGEAFNTELDEEMKKIERELEEYRISIVRSKAKKALHSIWMNHFMDEESELEHVAFLTLWLSWFVFPSGSVRSNVFPIAVLLSKGVKVSLAPLVLASIYRDLKLLREDAISVKETIQVWGPFQLIQLWVFEHFPEFRPTSLNTLKGGEPRVALWHNLSSKVNTLTNARSAFKAGRDFEWRPYAADVENWRHLPYYEEKKHKLLCNDSCLDLELCSFFKCLSAREIVGLDKKKWDYSPHRVAMQFGYDQDLPCDPKGFVLASENVNFYVSSRSYRGRASERYTKWHNDMMFVRDIAIQGVLKKEKYYLKIIKKASLLIEAKFDSPILHKSLSKKEMNEFLESSGGEEQLISSKKKSVITPVTDTSKKEEVSSDLSDDDNIPIGTLLKNNNSKDTEEVSSDLSDDDNIPIGTLLKKNNSKDTKVATDSDVLLSTTSSIVDESNKKRAHIAGDEISEGGLKKKPANNEGTKVKGKAKSTTKVQIETVHSTDEQETQPNKKGKKFGNAGKWFSPITIN